MKNKFIIKSIVSSVKGAIFKIFNYKENEFSYKQYVNGVETGWIGEDLKYKDIKNFIKISKKLKNDLEKNNDFIQIILENNPLQAGDILITDSTPSNYGIFGHTAIAISDKEIFHIQSFNHVPERKSLEWFIHNYDNGFIKIYRPTYKKRGENAAKWALDTYEYSNALYKIDMDLIHFDRTYCSKLVWQSYYYTSPKSTIYPIISPISPYIVNFLIKDIKIKGELKQKTEL